MTTFRFVVFLLFCLGCLAVPAQESSWHGKPDIYTDTDVPLVSLCADTTSVKENPWTAILFYDNKFQCGATILEDDIAITAARCVIGKRNDFFRLYYGRNIRPDAGIPDRGADKYGGDTGIEAIRIHPNYDLNNKYEGSDIAVLKLKNKIRFNQLVKPINVIPTKSKYTKMLRRGAYVKVAGFGQSSGPISGATKRDYPTHMQMIVQRIIPQQQCNRGTGNYSIGPAHDVLCTQGKCPKDSNNNSADFKQICPGDSGSGIVGLFQEENKYYLLGVVSYIITTNHEDCGKNSKPAFSTSTRDHRDFIYEPFPVDCVWTVWSEWTSCHQREPDSCEGVRTRTRSVSREALHGGKICIGKHTQEGKCTPGHFVIITPVDGFDVAIPQIDKTCPSGEACKSKKYCPDIRHKYCEIEGLDKSDETRKKIIKQLKGAVCNKKEKAFCCKGEKERNEPSILFLGNGEVEDWSAWSAWTPCSSTCGGGVQGRTRQCARSNPYNCPKQFQQDTRNCNSKPCENGCDTGPEVQHSSSTFVDENVIEYTCNQGYTIEGSPTLTCIEGAWFPSPPSCHSNCEGKPCHPSALCSSIPFFQCQCKAGEVGDPYKAGCHSRSRFTDVISDASINNCGFKRYSSITAQAQCGASVSARAAPWQVSIVYIGSHLRIHWCGGVLISPRHILSAAHCFESNECNFLSRQGSKCDKTHFRAYFGRTNATILHPDDTFLEDSNSVARAIEKVYIHPKWQHANRITGGNDISILTVQEVPENAFVRHACLPNPSQHFFLHQQENIIEISGFGRNNSDSTSLRKSFPHQLQLIEMKIIDKLVCDSRLTGEIAPDIFCAVPANDGTGECFGKPGSCKGDSGGPGVVKDKYNQYVVVGLVSGGPPCGEDKLIQPHYLTSVVHHLKFILDYIEELPCPPPLGAPQPPTCDLRFVGSVSDLHCQERLDCPTGARCFEFKCTFYEDDDQARLARIKCSSSQQCQEGDFICDTNIARCRPDKASNGTVGQVSGGIQTLFVPKISNQGFLSLPNASSHQRTSCSGKQPCPVRTTNNRITCHKAFCNRNRGCWCPYPLSRRLDLSTGLFVDPEKKG